MLGIIQLAIKAAPEVETVYAAAKKLFNMWFSGGVITAAEQATLMAWADAHQEATLAGLKPPELMIEPD